MLSNDEAQYLRAYVRKDKDVRAGVVLLCGAPNPTRKLHVARAEVMP